MRSLKKTYRDTLVQFCIILYGLGMTEAQFDASQPDLFNMSVILIVTVILPFVFIFTMIVKNTISNIWNLVYLKWLPLKSPIVKAAAMSSKWQFSLCFISYFGLQIAMEVSQTWHVIFGWRHLRHRISYNL